MELLLDSILEQLVSALPIIAAAAASYIVTAVNRYVGEIVPKFLYPVLLPIAGAVVAGTAKAVGVDIGGVNPSTADFSMWEAIIAGALTGGGAVWVYELRKSFARARGEDEIAPDEHGRPFV